MDTVVETLSEAIDDAAAVDVDTLTNGELDACSPATPTRRRDRPPGLPLGGPRSLAVGWFTRPWARLSRTAGVAGGTAKAIMRRGPSLATMPLTAEALAAGSIGTDHVDLLARAAGDGRNDLFAVMRPSSSSSVRS